MTLEKYILNDKGSEAIFFKRSSFQGLQFCGSLMVKTLQSKANFASVPFYNGFGIRLRLRIFP